MAKQNLEASVVYAAIVNLLKVEENPMQKVRGIKKKIGHPFRPAPKSVRLFSD
jgi:hypothetical protein